MHKSNELSEASLVPTFVHPAVFRESRQVRGCAHWPRRTTLCQATGRPWRLDLSLRRGETKPKVGSYVMLKNARRSAGVRRVPHPSPGFSEASAIHESGGPNSSMPSALHHVTNRSRDESQQRSNGCLPVRQHEPRRSSCRSLHNLTSCCIAPHIRARRMQYQTFSSSSKRE